jgi:transmembrane sensor
MNQYANYTLRDFIQDDLFIQWVKYPDADNTAHWESVRSAYPHQSAVMDHAAGLIAGFAAFYPDVPDSEIERGREAIMERYNSQGFWPLGKRRLYLSIAASILLLLGIAVWFKPHVPKAAFIEGAFIKTTDTEATNEGDSLKTISLPDGSTITLSPNSQVSYEVKDRDKREVYLEGEAFFHVAKNPDKPFFVYANGLVTKVLGTSFKVSAYPNGEVVKVAVSSGRVRVYKGDAGKEQGTSTGLTLTPNQQAVFSKKDQQLTRTVVEQPKVLITPERLKTYTYTDTPISKIFEGLEDIYGIKVVYDQEKFKNCRLNMSLSDESLFEKLELIGKVVEARYNVMDGQVIFIGEGCPE